MVAFVSAASNQSESNRTSNARKLLGLVSGFNPKLFRDVETGDAYIAPNGDGTEVWLLDSQRTERWLIRQWIASGGHLVGQEAIRAVIYMLDAIALEEIPLAVRVCWRDGVLWYDLGREAVRIDGRGWTIESNPPVLFKRFPDSLRQVQPARGGDFSLIDKYLPIDPMSDLSFLLKIWLLAGLSPNGPRPILDLAGGGGVRKEHYPESTQENHRSESS